mgnify:FL=1|tara:strand:- start:651 stop:1040 length:390 start_codon:yes stop_codon:yes gene_type:complete
MNKKITYLILLISSSSLYAEWSATLDLDVGGVAYIEKDTIRKIDGYVYFWGMTDYNERNEYGDLSSQVYYQGDCKNNRFKTISYSFFKFNTGRGEADHQDSVDKDWKYPKPRTVSTSLLEAACKHIGEG